MAYINVHENLAKISNYYIICKFKNIDELYVVVEESVRFGPIPNIQGRPCEDYGVRLHVRSG